MVFLDKNNSNIKEAYRSLLAASTVIDSILANNGDDRLVVSGCASGNFASFDLSEAGCTSKRINNSIKFSLKSDYVYGTPAGRIEVGMDEK